MGRRNINPKEVNAKEEQRVKGDHKHFTRTTKARQGGHQSRWCKADFGDGWKQYGDFTGFKLQQVVRSEEEVPHILSGHGKWIPQDVNNFQSDECQVWSHCGYMSILC